MDVLCSAVLYCSSTSRIVVIVQIEIPGKENTYQSFTFDAIADESATQGDFFDLSGVSELLDYAVAG